MRGWRDRIARIRRVGAGLTVGLTLTVVATGCRQVHFASSDRSIASIGTTDARDRTLTGAPDVNVTPFADPTALARPETIDVPSPTRDVAATIRAAAPTACLVLRGEAWRPEDDPDRPGELIRVHSIWQGARRDQVQDSITFEAPDESPTAGRSVRNSRWRSRSRLEVPRGIAVRLHGLDEAPIDRRLDDRLLDAGWMLVQYDSIELGGIGFGPGPGGRAARVVHSAADAGRVVDAIVAQVASAADRLVAAERSWLEKVSGTSDFPVIVVGTSFGGILAPTTAALVDDGLADAGRRLDAMVLLAAGGDLGAISATSPAMDLGPDVVPTVEMIEWRRVMRRAIESSRVDPLLVAPTLRHVPTLMLHGRFDEIVPARFGDQLWDALGRPDRFSYLAGHYGVLGLMAGEADQVIRWLDRRGLGGAGATPERRSR